jgi:hypothetical protein
VFDETTLQTLRRIRFLRNSEIELANERAELERKIASQLMPGALEGAKTFATPDLSVTVSLPVSKKVDQAKAGEWVRSGAPHPFREKFELDSTRFKVLSEIQPLAKRLSECITITPGKPSVSVKFTEDK